MKIINETDDITFEPTEVQSITRDSDPSSTNKLENLEDMVKFLETCNLPIWNHQK
jgi:hypothetical protein